MVQTETRQGEHGMGDGVCDVERWLFKMSHITGRDVGRRVLGDTHVIVDEDTRIAQDSSARHDERARLGCEGKGIGRKATRVSECGLEGRRATLQGG